MEELPGTRTCFRVPAAATVTTGGAVSVSVVVVPQWWSLVDPWIICKKIISTVKKRESVGIMMVSQFTGTELIQRLLIYIRILNILTYKFTKSTRTHQ